MYWCGCTLYLKPCPQSLLNEMTNLLEKNTDENCTYIHLSITSNEHFWALNHLGRNNSGPLNWWIYEGHYYLAGECVVNLEKYTVYINLNTNIRFMLDYHSCLWRIIWQKKVLCIQLFCWELNVHVLTLK